MIVVAESTHVSALVSVLVLTRLHSRVSKFQPRQTKSPMTEPVEITGITDADANYKRAEDVLVSEAQWNDIQVVLSGQLSTHRVDGFLDIEFCCPRCELKDQRGVAVEAVRRSQNSGRVEFLVPQESDIPRIGLAHRRCGVFSSTGWTWTDPV